MGYLIGAVVLILFLFFVVLPMLPLIGGVAIVGGLLVWNRKLARDRRRLQKRMPRYLK